MLVASDRSSPAREVKSLRHEVDFSFGVADTGNRPYHMQGQKHDATAGVGILVSLQATNLDAADKQFVNVQTAIETKE